MELLQLSFTTISLNDLVTDLLLDLNAITIQTVQDKITASFNSSSDLKRITNILKQSVQLTSEILIEKVTTSAWKQLFNPINIKNKMTIYPTNYNIPNNDNNLKVILNPESAFGTGTHPTTSLCLTWLVENIINYPNSTLLDYGCGTGILSIAASKLGVKKVIAIDDDRNAIATTEQNVINNQLTNKQIQVFLPENIPCSLKYDIIIANILADPLIDLANYFKKLLKPQGMVVLSGILNNQLVALIYSYRNISSNFHVNNKEGWALVSAKHTNLITTKTFA